jgi:hypothetical protein
MVEQKKSFPMLPIGHWWALRKRFRQSIPGVVTDNYVATVLNMTVTSARANVLPYLKTLGIIDEEGKTLPRAKLWRDDEHYSTVCKAALDEIYPKDLLEAVPNPVDRTQAERWFGNHTGLGAVAARRMAALYAVLMEADASKETEDKAKNVTRDKDSSRSKPANRTRTETPPVPRNKENKPVTNNDHPLPLAPGININLEIHISADATPDQIDQIFASMAKHIYGRS